MDKLKFDVVVIGGGPAGMLAAGRAGELGAKVLLIEKNESLGRKLLITGKGRCNITQAEFDDQEFIRKLKNKNGKFLFSSLAAFGPQRAIDFFEQKKVRTKIERGGRVFPRADQSNDVLHALLDYLNQQGVKFLFNAKISGFDCKDRVIQSVNLADGKIHAQNFILCTGGKSYPATGSTGDGYAWATSLGHKIVPPQPALVPVKTKDTWVKDLQGLSLKNIAINVFQNNKKQDDRFGEMLFTHFGLSGPIILDVSKKIGELLREGGNISIGIDLKPALDTVQLDKRLQRDFGSKSSNKDFKNYLPELVPQKMIDIMTDLSGIDPKKKINSITKDERVKLAKVLKDIRVSVDALGDYNQAIVTTGGVSLKEIDSRTMRSKMIHNLFFAGEIIDLDGPTGGYNLQICWSTGYAAGSSAASKP